MTEEFISWKDFEKVDIRTGTIIKVDDFPEAKKPAYKLTIDFGKLGIKKSSAQITNYKKENLLDKQILAVINFKPKQIANFFSECLVLGIIEKDNSVILLTLDKKTDNGKKIS